MKLSWVNILNHWLLNAFKIIRYLIAKLTHSSNSCWVQHKWGNLLSTNVMFLFKIHQYFIMVPFVKSTLNQHFMFQHVIWTSMNVNRHSIHKYWDGPNSRKLFEVVIQIHSRLYLVQWGSFNIAATFLTNFFISILQKDKVRSKDRKFKLHQGSKMAEDGYNWQKH